MQWCFDAGLAIYSGALSGPRTAGFGSFQVGSRGFDPAHEPDNICPSILACDHLWVARWALERIATLRKVDIQWDAGFTVLTTASEGELEDAFPDKSVVTPRTSLIRHSVPYVEVHGFDGATDPYEVVSHYLLWATGIDLPNEG